MLQGFGDQAGDMRVETGALLSKEFYLGIEWGQRVGKEAKRFCFAFSNYLVRFILWKDIDNRKYGQY